MQNSKLYNPSTTNTWKNCYSAQTDRRCASLRTATNKKLATFSFWTATKTNYASKCLDFQKKFIDTVTTSNFYLKFKENNENDMAAQVFWAVFLFQPTAEPNRPNSWFRLCCHSIPYIFHAHSHQLALPSYHATMSEVNKYIQLKYPIFALFCKSLVKIIWLIYNFVWLHCGIAAWLLQKTAQYAAHITITQPGSF